MTETGRPVHARHVRANNQIRTAGDLVTGWAVSNPDRPAVISGEEWVTYQQLDREADVLAGCLLAAGVSRGAMIAVCLDRSVAAVVAILATFRAGGCYVPVNRRHPAERLKLVLNDTDAAVVVTESRFAHLFRGCGRPVLMIDAPLPMNAEPAEIAVDVVAEDVAYVIYTSGSTGRPKGVMVSHRSLLSYSASIGRTLGLTSDDRVLQCRSLDFDASIEEIFLSLVHGATLVVGLDFLDVGYPQATDFLIESKITFASLPTNFFQEWVHADRRLARLGECSLKTVVVAGETLPRNAVEKWKSEIGESVGIWNLYGPTECTVTSTAYHLDENWHEANATSVSIGDALPGTELLVLDDQLTEVPEGVAGELYISGPSVAYGYLGMPALTAERFVPGLPGSPPGARWYRTGDLVRRRPKCGLEFLRRTDNQLKVRGHRIEPGEVEAVLCAHPDVRSCAVTVHDADNQLQCHVAANLTEVGEADLYSYLGARLPAQLVPDRIVLMDELPTGVNGKVDRARLRRWQVPVRRDETFVGPANEVEEMVALVWSETLGLTDIGMHTDFFHAGGHSLLALRALAWIHDLTGVELSTRDFFRTRTPRALAELLAEKLDDTTTAVLAHVLRTAPDTSPEEMPQ